MNSYNPFKKCRCPYCAEEFYPGQCDIISSRTGMPIHIAKKNFLERYWVPALEGSNYTKELALRQCPACKKLLPRNFERTENYTIVVIGGSESGKSYYIGACIDQLQKGHAWQLIGCTRIIGQGRTDSNYKNNYYHPMYIEHEKIKATRSETTNVQEPLIYEIVFRKKSRLKPVKKVNLLFYNSGGSDMRDLKRMVYFNHYILNASAIIFLVDPQYVPDIANKLPDHLKPPLEAELLHKTADVLNRILETFEQGSGKKPGSTIQIPIAITVSKSDLLKFVTKHAKAPYFLSKPAFSNKLEAYGFEIIDREVQGILRDAGERELLTSVRSFTNKNFFAVSATGSPPDAMGKFPTIEPLRCLDPLLWILWKLDLLDQE